MTLFANSMNFDPMQYIDTPMTGSPFDNMPWGSAPFSSPNITNPGAANPTGSLLTGTETGGVDAAAAIRDPNNPFGNWGTAGKFGTMAGIAGTLGQGILGYMGLQQAQDQFDWQKSWAEKQNAMAMKDYNTQLQDRRNARMGASGGRGYISDAEFDKRLMS